MAKRIKGSGERRAQSAKSPSQKKERSPASAPARPAFRSEDEVAFRRAVARLAAGVGLLSLLRLYAMREVGFGDSEALYASYALFPQAAYLDHPGLVGVIARALGGDAAPTPGSAHGLTTCLLAILPWIGVAAARGLGAQTRGALAMGWLLAVTPEIAIGLFGLTPDVPLAFAWIGALGLCGAWLSGDPDARPRAMAAVGAGLCAGIAAVSKVSGLLLFPILALAHLHAGARTHARKPWPWLGLVAGAVVVAPVALYESRAGWPMLVHRLVSTQAGAGFSLRNAGALLGGQLLYVSPVLCVLGVVVARAAVKKRTETPLDALLFWALVVPGALLSLLCLWSRVAEPHWVAPAWLAIGFAYARDPLFEKSRFRVREVAVGTALAMVAAVHAWVLLPQASRLRPASADAKLDIANELHGWPVALEHVSQAAIEERSPADPDGRDFVVVGPHWTVCAQLRAGLPRTIRVGCMTPIRDDFDDWEPRDRWKKAERVLFVSDSRFGPDPPEPLPGHVRGTDSRVSVFRGGRSIRTFTFRTYERRAHAMNDGTRL